ncbi:hypothetical protein [Pedobacter cryoconitis]|uniref:hypothetical protein n=1 Tax=Pedobacter cryoconitis TaxID=188932 RepID=UPI0018DE466F|nr:hypothetical protein [Pedobacter cryoconitis]
MDLQVVVHSIYQFYCYALDRSSNLCHFKGRYHCINCLHAEVEISPLLLGIGHQQVFGDMVNSWSSRMPVEKAVHIRLSLMNAGILCEA